MYLQDGHTHSVDGGDSPRKGTGQFSAAEEAADSSAFLDAAALGQQACQPARGTGKAAVDAVGRQNCSQSSALSRNRLKMLTLNSQKWLSSTSRMIATCFSHGHPSPEWLRTFKAFPVKP